MQYEHPYIDSRPSAYVLRSIKCLLVVLSTRACRDDQGKLMEVGVVGLILKIMDYLLRTRRQVLRLLPLSP